MEYSPPELSSTWRCTFSTSSAGIFKHAALTWGGGGGGEEGEGRREGRREGGKEGGREGEGLNNWKPYSARSKVVLTAYTNDGYNCGQPVKTVNT